MIHAELMSVPGPVVRDEIIRSTQEDHVGVAAGRIQPAHAAFFGFVAATAHFRKPRLAWRHMVGQVANLAPTETTLGLAVGIEDNARSWRPPGESLVRYGNNESLSRDGVIHLIDALAVTGPRAAGDPIRNDLVLAMAYHGARALRHSEKVEAGASNRSTWVALGLPEREYTFNTFYRGLEERKIPPESTFLAAASLVDHEPHSVHHLGALAARSERAVHRDPFRLGDPTVPPARERLYQAARPIMERWDRPTWHKFQQGYLTEHSHGERS